MSDVSSELGAAGRKRTINELASRLNRKASAERLSLSAHLSIGRLLCKLRDAIVAGETLNKQDAMKVLCAGISFYRRHTLGDAQEEDEDSTETTALLKRSATLIFVLLASIEARNNELVDIEGARAVVEQSNESTLANVLGQPSREGAEGETEQQDEPTWEDAMERVSPAELTLSVLKLAARGLSRPSKCSELDALADTFFRASASCMASRLLLKEGSVDFVSLSGQKSDIPRAKRLLAMAQAGESEAGQSCLRDILLSFLLPSRIVGVRRNLLLSRAASTSAGVDYAEAVNTAHSVAMAGTEWIWKHGTSELERACALLAGIAVLITRGGDDPMRKQDAFMGRMSFPWLETTAPPDGTKRLALLPEKQRWILYKIHPKTGKPVLICSLRGFEGLCECLLQFL